MAWRVGRNKVAGPDKGRVNLKLKSPPVEMPVGTEVDHKTNQVESAQWIGSLLAVFLPNFPQIRTMQLRPGLVRIQADCNILALFYDY